MNFRIGEGWDVHALVAGRKLIIGGVEVPFHLGLLGHSDADVLLHAITDALLGAAALGDIGTHFPDNDTRFADADSLLLLSEAARRVREKGFEIGNVDSTVIAQAPETDALHPGHARADRAGADAAGGTGQRQGQNGRKNGPGRSGPGDAGPGSGIAVSRANPYAVIMQT
jgi:2-C-methyl-D-erythritol 2,4-cyclodiphosphate synthase